MRAKRSNSSKKEGRRTFAVRIERFTGGEELIEFVNGSTTDFELRSRDLAAFSYLNGELRIVQNLKIGQYLTVSKPACYVATFVYGGNSVEVAALRTWRDERLLSSKSGAIAVRMYYLLSPVLIKCAGRSHVAKQCAKVVVDALLRRLQQSPPPS